MVGCVEFEEPRPLFGGEQQNELQTRSLSSLINLEDPYALANVQAAWDNIAVERGLESYELQPTHHYVRFLPQDSTQMKRLQELNLELFDYPMDIKLEEGQEYVDPTIPEGEQGWLYTTVEADYELPNDVNYEILDECYIPEDGETIEVQSQSTTRSGGSTMIDLEKAAFQRVGYDVDPTLPESDPLNPGILNVKPQGTITVWDNSKSPAGYVPVKGVKVRCHVVVKWSTTYTREDGSYTMRSNFA